MVVTASVNTKSLPDFKLIPYTNPQTSADEPTSIKILRTSSWTYCGPLLSLSDDFPPSYDIWHQATVDGNLATLLHPFLQFVHEFLAKTGLSHYWLTIRATKPNDDFNMPRWHTDDDFFNGKDGDRKSRTQWKLCGTLVGPGTLFMDNGPAARTAQKATKLEAVKRGEHICTSVICLGCASVAEWVRERLAETFKDSSVSQASTNECCFFKVGAKEGAVHSEPPLKCDRIFINIVPGKEEELREIMTRWGMEFPRAWHLGVPFDFATTDDLSSYS
ncbi:hypothetical protein ABW19_dt0202632 [Dactylella cylindrospora]|nr:hypothetical protein ABW19_dt0202632 [Dactylella cylindrospora]